MALAGGLTKVRDVVAGDGIQELVDQFRSQIETQLNRSLPVLTAILYSTQVVAGINYYVKAQVGSTDEYVHARIYKNLQGNAELSKVAGGKDLTSGFSFDLS